MKKKGLVLFVALTIVLGLSPVLQAAGTEPTGTPREVSTLDHLLWISTNSSSWGDDFIQTGDIDASATSGWNVGDHDGDAGTPDVAMGFSPIGNSGGTNFTGSYDGQYYSIDGIYINRPSTNNIGFFGAAAFDVVIEKLELTNVTVYGNEYAGGLVGLLYNSGTVSQCSVSGSVDGESRTGGLIGEIQTSSIVELSSSSANVTSTTRLGGFVYRVYDNCTIRNCYSLGDVTRKTGGGNTYEGAFCGYYTSDCTIENCYSIGSVYFTGATNPTDRGFCGLNNNGTTPGNFWDSEASNQLSALRATAKITDDMKTASTFTDAGWNSSLWYMDSGINSGYPYLAWQNTGGTPLPVELDSFTGELVDDGVQLNWETATETNNYGFEVQKSEDRSQNSEKSWEAIGFVQGHGTTNSPKNYEFIDSQLPISDRVNYRLKQIDNDGTFAYSKIVTVDLTTITSVKDEGIPIVYSLSQNYPNPFNPTTTIRFGLPESGIVNLTIYNILGEKVTELVNEEMTAGYHQVVFGTDNIASGMYIYRISVGNKFAAIKKMLMIK